MNTKRKTAVAYFILLLCLILTGCSGANQSQSGTTLTTTQPTSEVTVATETVQESTEKATEASTKTATDSTTKAIISTAKSTTKASDKKQSTTHKSHKTTSKSTTKDEYCYLTVECGAIHDNIDDLKAGHEDYVPSDGYIIKNAKYKVKPDDTVYDVLKAVCKEQEIRLTAQSTQYSIYIIGINNIDEKDCGKQSGWIYYVNGKQPNVACDRCKVKVGDKIKFSYICEYQ